MVGPASPFDDPVPRGLRIVVATLKIVVAVQCWGVAAAILHGHRDFHMPEFLKVAGNFSPIWSKQFLHNISYGLLAVGGLTLFRPVWPLLLLLTGWFATLAAATFAKENDWPQVAIESARVFAPLALLLLEFWPPASKFSLGRSMAAVFFLRTTSAAAFLGFGVKLLLQARSGGPLVALTVNSLRQIVDRKLDIESGAQVTAILGGLTLALGIGLMVLRSRFFAFLMMVVGLFLAALPILGGKPSNYPDTLSHIALAGVPFSLFLHWLLAVKEQPPILVPDRR
ncbi:MAG: hypothetical protein R3C01_14605 [Planctomycetaceae bacterium]